MSFKTLHSVYIYQQFLRLTEVCSYLCIIHLYLSISRSIVGGPAFFHPCEIWSSFFPVLRFPPLRFGPVFSSPAFSTPVFFTVPCFSFPRFQRPRCRRLFASFTNQLSFLAKKVFFTNVYCFLLLKAARL